MIQALFLMLTLPLVIAAADCPLWKSNQASSVPRCPKQDVKMLDDTFPVSHFSISNFGLKDSELNELIRQLKTTHLAGEPSPVVMVSSKITANPDAFVPTHTVDIYQQDVGKPLFDSATGQPVFRAFPRGEKFSVDNETRRLMQTCGVEIDKHPIDSYEAGGNVQILPTGLCVIGNQKSSAQDWQKAAKDLCADPKNAIGAPNGFLRIGHTDEVMKVLPRNKPEAGGCPFSILLASPDAAIKALKGRAKDSFFGEGEVNDHLCRQISESYGEQQRLKHPEYRQYQKDYKEWEEKAKARSSSGLWPLLMPQAHAGVQVEYLPGFVPPPEAPKVDVDFQCKRDVTNEVFLSYLNDNEGLKSYNSAIQKQMDGFQKDLTDRLRARGLNCRLDFIPAPQLYYGDGQGLSTQENNIKVPTGDAIHPPMANSDNVGSLWVIPRQNNTAFTASALAIAKRNGLRPLFLDTTVANGGGGNIHCLSQVLRYCRP